MADVGVQYDLTTPAGTIIFNDGSLDQFYITKVRGLGSPDLRTPMDKVPLGHGALFHPFFKGARHIGVEGIFLIESTRIQNNIVVIRNEMEFDLTEALESLLDDSTGTFTFAPQGFGSRTFVVKYEVGFEPEHGDNYISLYFSFGLVAAEPDWSGSS